MPVSTKAIAWLLTFACVTITGVLAPSARRMILYAYCTVRCVRFCGGQAWFHVMLMPCGTATACSCCGVAGVGTRETAARFEGRSLLPEWLCVSTVYAAKSPPGESSRPV